MPRLLGAWVARARLAGPAGLVGGALVALAIAIALAVGLRGIAAPFPAGHFSTEAGIGIFADNMWRWHTLLPVIGYQEHAPPASAYYLHHPLGIFWVTALCQKVLGAADWVVRLPALLYLLGTTWFLSRIGRLLWGPISGGLVALAYVALPITLGYAGFNDLEQPVMFGCVAATWGYLRFIRDRKDRYAAASVLGFLFAVNCDWWAYVWGGVFLAGLFVLAYVVPERMRRELPQRSFGRYWALMSSAAVVSLLVLVAMAISSGRLSDMIGMYGVRSSGNSAPLAAALTARAYRIELMFTPIAIALGKLAVPIIVARAALTRSHLELLPLPLLCAAVVQYVVFKQGADVHIFWPHPFAAYFALAVGALAASLRDALAWVAPRLHGVVARLARQGQWLAAVLVGLPILFVLRDGLSLVRLAHETGGRFAEANLDSYVDASVALRWFLGRSPAPGGIAFVGQMAGTWTLQWDARPRVSQQRTSLAPPPSLRVLMLDSRVTPVAELRDAAGRFAVNTVGPYWLIDRTQPAAPLTGHRFDEREPRWYELCGGSGVEPVRAVAPDPWVTWEWRTLLGQAAVPPQAPATTTDQLRIAHNAALASGDATAAASLQSALRARLNHGVSARYENGTELIGAIRSEGAERSLTMFFVAGTFATDTRFSVQARVFAGPRLSTLPIDPALLDLATPPVWPTSLWRKGQIYALKIVYRKRPGRERLTGGWGPGGPRRVDAAEPVALATF